jgi:hypothetical protein
MHRSWLGRETAFNDLLSLGPDLSAIYRHGKLLHFDGLALTTYGGAEASLCLTSVTRTRKDQV